MPQTASKRRNLLAACKDTSKSLGIRPKSPVYSQGCNVQPCRSSREPLESAAATSATNNQA